MPIPFVKFHEYRSIAGGNRRPAPGDAGFVQAFSDFLIAERYLAGPAIARARRAGDVAGERLDQVLVKLGLISEGDLCRAYAAYGDLPILTAAEMPEHPVLADRLKPSFLRANRLLPAAFDGRQLLLATPDPFVDEAIRAIRYMLDVDVRLALLTPADLERALRAVYRDTPTEAPADEAGSAVLVSNEGSELDVERLKDIANEAPIIRLVNQIISRAVERGASDVHIEPGRDAVAIRYRIDGFLQNERTVPATSRAALTTRVKIMAKLDIAERRLPQDGRIKTIVRGTEIEIRVSTLPTAFGESVVLRILDSTRVEIDFTRLGLDEATQQRLNGLMSLPNGIILVTGPTGSGKTTTLYTALKQLNRPEVKLFTVEDPVEYQLSGINQVQVQPKIGLDFPAALRSILRQDPDVVMIGEIRDSETARIAIQASLTGHLVFSTLHTNSAMGAITRLLDIGLEHYLIASTVAGIMAQRLVRKLCPSCSQLYRGTISMAGAPDHATPVVTNASLRNRREPIGCIECAGTGYHGRTTISELLVIDDGIREAIGRRSQDLRTVEQLARASGFRSLYEDGLIKVGRGETSLEEILRVTRVT